MSATTKSESRIITTFDEFNHELHFSICNDLENNVEVHIEQQNAMGGWVRIFNFKTTEDLLLSNFNKHIVQYSTSKYTRKSKPIKRYVL